MTTSTISCPYCQAPCEMTAPRDFAPRYETCSGCGRRFVAEPMALGISTYRECDAPCCSDPDCRELEMGMGND